jgi:hypothetical protein
MLGTGQPTGITARPAGADPRALAHRVISERMVRPGKMTGPSGAGGEPKTDPVAVHPVVVADAALGRVVARLSTEYVLRSAKLLSELTNGDLVAGLVLHVIITGNINYIDNDPKTAGRYASIEDIAPDEARRPISVLSVAGSLGLPYETTRRCVSKLIKAGLCIRVRGGVIAPSAVMEDPRDNQAILANMANVRRFCRALKRVGMEIG